MTITDYCYSQQSNLAIMFNRIRGPKPGTTAGRKRKALDELSRNPHTQKSRARREQMTEAEKEIDRAKLADAQHARRWVEKARQTEAWKCGNPNERQEIEKCARAAALKDRYVRHCSNHCNNSTD